MYLFPLLDFRLKGDYLTTYLATSPAASPYIIISISVVLLLVVCINFINLSIARHMYRIREIGLRKVIGAKRSQLIRQFTGESLLLSMLSVPAAVVLYELIHPVFSSYIDISSIAGTASIVSNSLIHYPFLLKYLIIAALITGLISGLYPAVFLSSLQPAQALKGTVRTDIKKGRVRRIMIVFQYSLSIIFIIAAGVSKDQFGYLLDADLGYSRDNIAVVQVSGKSPEEIALMKNEFSRFSDVLSISGTQNLPGIWESASSAHLPEANEESAVTVEAFGVDYGFIEALKMELTGGRSFSPEHVDNSNFVISEHASRLLFSGNPVGQELTVSGRTGTVIGVVKDFLFGDIGLTIPPALLYIEPENINYLLIAYPPNGNFPELRTQIKEKWASIGPDIPFECYTLNDYFYDFFRLLNSIAGFMNIIGITAMFFSCLGLLGLASFMVERRTKEIGIRKALGASSVGIVWHLIKEFVILVVIANCIILPVVYFAWDRALQIGLQYIKEISAGTFLFAVIISIFAALAAVISQTLKAARANPVDSLRYE
ncbi:FtsX-like permease family protein [candidate division KSB1 bacterium]